MNINRNNYEEFFLLYADNELSLTEKQSVEAFIAQHPDLKPELDMILQAILPDEQNICFSEKEVLFRTTDKDSQVNLTNYEDYFVRYADDELNNEEKAATELFVYKNPECQEDFELIQQVKYAPELTVQFPDKESLYKRSGKKRAVIGIWMRFAAAALVLLIAGLFWLQRKNTSVTATEKVVANKSNKQIPSTSGIESNPAPAFEKTENTPFLAKKSDDSRQAQPKTESGRNLSEQRKETLQSEELVAERKTEGKSVDHLLATNENSAITPEIEITAPEKQTSLVITKPVIVETEKAPTVEYVNAAKEDIIYVSGSDVVRKTPLRGLLRKASRFVEQNNPLNSDHKKSGVFTASNEQQ
jgi:hypothetical protein